jgi:hypothetical protein
LYKGELGCLHKLMTSVHSVPTLLIRNIRTENGDKTAKQGHYITPLQTAATASIVTVVQALSFPLGSTKLASGIQSAQ